jgi:hypothetical protein
VKAFLYLIIIALILIILKAFYFDEWLEKRGTESNVSIEANQSNSEHAVSETVEDKPKSANTDEGLPITEMGDSISQFFGRIFK